MKELIGYLGTKDSSTSLGRGGTIYMYLHDPWDKTGDLTDEDEIKRRKWFDFCKEVIASYKETHFPPEEEDKEKRFLNLAMVEKQPENESGVLVPLIPTGARAGTLADFAEAVKEYDVEKIVSPVRGADYAIQVTGDSMAPEYEPGCHVLIKKVFEDQFIEWGKTYVLDSDNGAVIKKIFPTEDAAVVESRSVNPAYPPFRVRTEHVHGWYRVLMIMALK
jgi:phage repressor protein C with HTH and peptisase S24 domain